MTRAPVRPPPGPWMPGIGSDGPGCSPQQAVESDVLASSVVMMRRPSRWNAGDFLMRGTHTDRKWSTDTSPPLLPPVASLPLHGASWPLPLASNGAGEGWKSTYCWQSADVMGLGAWPDIIEM